MDLENYVEFVSRYKNLDSYQQIHIFNSLIKEIPAQRIDDVRRIQNFIFRYKRQLQQDREKSCAYVKVAPDPNRFYSLGISKIKTKLRTLLDAAHVVLVDDQMRVVMNYIVRHKSDDIINTFAEITGFNYNDRWIFQHKGKSRKFIIHEITRIVGTATLIGFDLKIQAESLYWGEMLRTLSTIDFHNFFKRKNIMNPGKEIPVGARHLFHHYLKYDILKGPQSAVVTSMLTMRLFKQVYLPMIKEDKDKNHRIPTNPYSAQT